MGELLMRARGFCSQLRETFSTAAYFISYTVTLPDCWWSARICSGFVANCHKALLWGQWGSIQRAVLFLVHGDDEKREDKTLPYVTYRRDKLWQHPRSTLFRLNELIWWPRWKESLSLSVNKASLWCVQFPGGKKTVFMNELNWCEVNVWLFLSTETHTQEFYMTEVKKLMRPYSICSLNMMSGSS